MPILSIMGAATAMHDFYRWRKCVLTVLLSSVMVGSGGCGSDATGTSLPSAADGYFALELNQHAITMAVQAPYNAIQLQATPRTAAGALIPSAGGVQYHVVGGDTSITVTPTGLVTARAPTYQEFFEPSLGVGGDANDGVASTPVSGVIASLTVNGTTLADTAYIRVTETAPVVPLASVSIQPPADSLRVYQSGGWLIAAVDGLGSKLPLIQRDADGAPIDNPVVYVTTSDPSTVFLSGGHGERRVNGIKAGEVVTLALQTWYYGVMRADSLTVKVGYPNRADVTAYIRTPFASQTPELYWWPTVTNISAPGRIIFHNLSPDIAIDVVFDDSSHVREDTVQRNRDLRNGRNFPQLYGSGNVPAYALDTLGTGAACEAAQHDGTTPAADSACSFGGLAERRYRFFPTPGTYTYHTRFGNGGQIVVH